MSGFLSTLSALWEAFKAVIPPGAVATAVVLIGLITVLAIWRHIV